MTNHKGILSSFQTSFPIHVTLASGSTTFIIRNDVVDVISNIWDPYPVISKSNFCYFVTFDDCSRVTSFYLMKNHTKLWDFFCTFHAKIRNQIHTSIHNLERENANKMV